MAFIQEGSEPSMLLENHLFYLPSTLTERWNTRDYDVGPAQATFDDASDITFDIAPSYTELISLADIRFTCELFVNKTAKEKTVTTDKTEEKVEDIIAPINNIIHSLFQTVTVTIGGRTISDSSNLYHMRAYLESLLGYSTAAQTSQLSSAGWCLDTNLEKEHIVNNKFQSDGAKTLQNIFLKQNTIQLSGKLHCDLFQQDKPLLPGVEMTVRLVKNKTALCFMANKEDALPTIAIRNPKLRLRKYEPSPDYLTALNKQLTTTTAKYHLERVVMRQHTLMKGQQHCAWSNIVIGQLPKIMIFGMVPNDAFTGVYNKTPFNFHHFYISNINTEVNGQLYPTRGYELDFEKGMTLTAYDGLLDVLERLNEPSGELAFDRHVFNKGGFTLFGFDFTTGHTGRGSLSLIKHGNLNMNIIFKKPLDEGAICLAMLVFDNVIEINNNRQVLFDFAS
jgi:hypothetical protein